MKKLFLLCIISFFINLTFAIAGLPDSIKWTPAGIGGGGGMFSPAISPHDGNLLFVSCDMSGVYRSSDAGVSWEMINYRQLSSSIRCAPVFHPENPAIIWDDSQNKLMQSIDYGLNWSQVWDMPGYPDDMIALHDAHAPLCILIAVEDFGLYRSGDGVNFIKIQSLENVVLLAEDDPNVIAASNSSLWLSEDRGLSFNPIGLPSGMNNPEGIIDIAIADGAIYLPEQTKLWQSKDMGNSWSVIENSQKYDRGNFRFVRAANNYVWVTTAGGGKYQPTALLSDNSGENFEPVFFCNDSWDDKSNLERGWLSLDFNCGWGGPAIGFAIDRNNPETALWTDYGRTLATFNAGNSWEALYTALAEGSSRNEGSLWQSSGLEVTSSWDLFISPVENDFINVAYTDIGGAYSADGGVSWRSTYDGGLPNKIYKTSDGGKNWVEKFSINLPLGIGFKDIRFADKNHGFCIGFQGHEFQTTDGGESWFENFIDSQGFVDISVYYPNPSLVYVGDCTGVFRLINDNINSVEEYLSLKDKLFVYPNPGNNNSYLNFILNNTEKVILKIYDLNGRELETIINKFMEAGKHTIIHDISRISSGEYFYNIQIGMQKESRKLLLIR